jgi:AraC-like DNA-binding protein
MASIAVSRTFREMPIEDTGMPSSAVYTFSDPDEYASGIIAKSTELTVTKPGQFSAKLIQIRCHQLWLQRFSESLSWVGHAVTLTSRASILFSTTSGPPLYTGGLEMLPTNLIRLSVADFHLRRPNLASYAGMSLPAEDLVALGEAIGEVNLAPPRDCLLVSPQPSAIAKLQRLHAAAGRLAEDAPEIIAHPVAAHGLEQVLIEAMIDCLASREVNKYTLAQGQHAIVMRRFRRVVEENPEHPLYITEICKAIGVSSRTLEACCHEHLGMSPKHYLLLRRMHLARRALRQAAPMPGSVTEIATRYGFWHLGRFAVEYQSLFGVSPSATLLAPPE